jgi:hypothetical protein
MPKCLEFVARLGLMNSLTHTREAILELFVIAEIVPLYTVSTLHTVIEGDC